VSEQLFWEEATRKGLPRFRFLRRSTPLAELDRRFRGTLLESEWERLKASLQPGDRIWPFSFNTRAYLGLREGYVVLRNGKPVGGIITTVS
jgi:hypothetical protein